MTTALLLPLRLDALVLPGDRTVAEAQVDFSRLPWVDSTPGRQRDVRPEIPNLSEEIVAAPFQDRGLTLKAGTHLHWALPDGLTQALPGTGFPAVPNRWLVSRSLEGEIQGRWVVESDYLHPSRDLVPPTPVTVPLDPRPEGEPPFRFLGRTLPYEAWLAGDPGAEHLEGLTAVGWGEPSFAAFYPNCASVFGFWDGAVSSQIDAGLTYEVLGWYADPETDELGRLVRRLTAEVVAGGGEAPTSSELLAAVEDVFGWTFSIAEATPFPELLVAYARLRFSEGGSPQENPVSRSEIGLAVGNTGTEALSAWLAAAIDPDHKTTLEDQLEAVQLGELDHRVLDYGAKFEEARHAKGFAAVNAGSRWSVRPASAGDQPADADDALTESQVTLPDPLAVELDALNALQAAWDAALAEIVSRRRAIFVDWYKYMLTAYPPELQARGVPDPDQIRYFIEQRGLPILASAIDAAGTFTVTADATTGDVTGAAATSGRVDSLAARLAAAVNGLVADLAALGASQEGGNGNGGNGNGGAEFVLRRGGAPRFWQPSEPVVLMVGDAVSPTPRHGQDGDERPDGLLEGSLATDLPSATLVPDDLDALEAAVGAALDAAGAGSIGWTDWTEQPWHPLLLEWEAELFPTRDGNNQATPDLTYEPDYVTRSWNLLADAVDLTLREGKGALTRGANTYLGSTVLSPHAPFLLGDALTDYLLGQEELLDAFYADAGLMPPANPEAAAATLLAEIDELAEWYLANRLAEATPAEIAADPVYTAIRALDALLDLEAQSQSLGGFNQALRMQKQTPQLAIADPLGFPSYRDFSERVAGAVGSANDVAPMPLAGFNPIRAGALRIGRLRLVDTFGQVRDLAADRVVYSAPLTLSGNPQLANLPPRLVQPARLDVRWLSAAHDQVEMSEHPASSPICGWLIVNRLDRSLAVYDAAGVALGEITPDPAAMWQSPAGSDVTTPIDQLPNPHLARVVGSVVDGGVEFLEALLRTLDAATAAMEPETWARTPSTAFLAGRPLAVVRTRIELELLGLPATHHGWNALRRDLEREGRETDGFTGVGFPVRVGEYRQLNDGVAGYWVEDGSGRLGETFFAPLAEASIHDGVETHAERPFNLIPAVDDPPLTLTVLFDPRGRLHATSGVVPAKAIDIPPDQYSAALSALQVTFLTTPILSPAEQVRLPLSEMAGFRWSWLELGRDGWSERATAARVRKQSFVTAFGQDEGTAIWDELAAKGWITIDDGDGPSAGTSATVTPKDQRTSELDAAFGARIDAIGALLLGSWLGRIDPQADFTGTQLLREGWLKLVQER